MLFRRIERLPDWPFKARFALYVGISALLAVIAVGAIFR
jgi:hypothetical protein